MFPRWPQQAHNHEVSRADTVSVPRAPTQAEVAAVLRIMTPLRKVIKPKVYGIENVPTERAFLVGNHNTLGLVDAPLLAAELWERGRIVRSLGDHAHFKIPGWRDALTRTGVVEGTREITSELMRRGELVMVFPGGAREVNKRKNERYKLVWKNRLGFARLAMTMPLAPPAMSPRMMWPAFSTMSEAFSTALAAMSRTASTASLGLKLIGVSYSLADR